MKVLIACEFSGVVRDAFRALGHDAWSCDLRPTEADPRYHIQADFRSAVQESWDFVGYHYTCKVMANSGARWLYRKVNGKRVRFEPRWKELDEAAGMFNLTLSDTRPGYSENPIQHKHAKARILREQDQVIQPWWFGEEKFKATCLWLRNVLPLSPTNKLVPPKSNTPEHAKWSEVHREPPSPEREKNRSRTYPGIAAAMAKQWGGECASLLESVA